MKKLIVLALLLTSQTCEAVYESHSDTGTEIFDYIENRRRAARENVLTSEQRKLQADIAEARLRAPEADTDLVPAAFEGDDMEYNAVTGEFVARGKVDIIQLDGYRFQTDLATGNVIKQEVNVPDKAHMLQIAEGAPRITLDGYKAVYNYGTKTGTMEKVKGRAGEYFISGKRIEFYPDHVVIFDGRQTKCNAKVPDYSVSAERIEIFPEQIMRMYNARLWIKKQVVGTREYMERKLDESDENYFPTFGYDKDDGVTVEDTFELPIMNHVKGVLNAYVTSKNGVRSNAEIHYTNRDFALRGLYGFYRDDNANWLQKEPSLDVYYSRPLGKLPLVYSAEYEVGHWKNKRATSQHQELEFGLTHAPINLQAFTLHLHTSYKMVRDNVDGTDGSQSVRGMNYDAVLFREFNDRLAAYGGYHYQKSNSQNSVFDFGLDSYSQKLDAGISFRLTDRDRIVAGCRYDLDSGRLADVDYYWYRDLHCSTVIFRWRAKRDKFEAHWQFTPW